MTNLPITHMTLYKHGVGYYVRRGPIEGASLKLTFRREEMDDLLKSLTVLDHGGGRVHGIDYDTPQSQVEKLTGCSIILDDKRSLRDLLVALRGRAVALTVSDGSRVEGLLLGLDEADEKAQKQSLVALLRAETEQVVVLSMSRIEGVELQDETAAGDLRFFLQTALGQETHRSITIRLSAGEHDLEVSYIAPAPTWRVSYRLVVEAPAEEEVKVLLQGWGIFDNRLEEDLAEISLSLTAGMPISFVYDLYTPHTPERPVVQDENRVAAGPVMFEAGLAGAVPEAPPAPAAAAPLAMAKRMAGRTFDVEAMASTVESMATGQAMGELFQYNVSVPVSVGRGQSAMAPIVSSQLAPKKELIYNGRKQPTHPVATLRFPNSTGLTLERGPVTVLENGEYVGEAVLPFTADQAEAVVAYAVELGVHIKEDLLSRTELHALEVKEGYLLQQLYDIRQVTYTLDNRTAQAKTILIEHPIISGYTNVDTPAPEATTSETQRYRVEVGPRRLKEFSVRTRRLRSQREALQNQSYQGLKRYLEGKFLDRKTYEALTALLDAWGEIAKLEQRLKAQEQERDKIYKAQEQIRKSLSALATDGEEGRLRGRYVKQLEQSENQLAEIAQAIGQIRAEIDQRQAKNEQMMAALG